MAINPSSDRSRYDVFLNFRREDTRHNFTNHLLDALKSGGINVFIDEDEGKLEKGDEVAPALWDAIAKSKISIVILSKGYASSKSCLMELSRIMECKFIHDQVVLPVFYHVEPSDVRKLTGSFKRSFDGHGLIRNPMEVERWKDAFTRVGNLNGWHVNGDRWEIEHIKDITGVVIKKLNSKDWSEELVGIDDQIKKISFLVNQEHIRVVGIWGMGGIGKTSLAEAVYNVLCDSKFAAHYFLRDVRERSLEKCGMQSLQTELLSRLLKRHIHIDTPNIGSTLIQERLHDLKVFVVFDDVNDFDQIERLGAYHFGLGSKIIVTSRDQQVLENIGVDVLHKVEELNKDDSLKLFCKFAFKQCNLVADFQDLAIKFVKYCGGNPLALKIYGAALYSKGRDEWESAFDKLEEYPEEDIFGPLRISYDGLDDLEKNIFLDLACFELIQARYHEVRTEFSVSCLFDKCLVYGIVDALDMHVLLREMGKYIVRKESEDPGRRSRLWRVEDVRHVLKNNTGTRAITGISLDMSQMEATLQICPTIFERMVNLALIRFQDGRYNMEGHNKLLVPGQTLTYLPDTLGYFQWDYCPLKCLPSTFNANNLVELRLAGSNIEQLWNKNQNVVNLRLMDLRWSKNIGKIPNLSRATNLETLLCSGCESLVELPCMTHLTSLKQLHVSGCSITKFPEIPTNLEELFLSDTGIEELPLFFGSLKKLYSLHMDGTKIRSIPSSIVKLDVLECISLNMTPIEELPSSISRLLSLKELHVRNCRSLKSLLELPPRLEVLDAEDCTSLERVSFTAHEYVRELNGKIQFRFRNCFNLNQDARDEIIAAYPMIIIQAIAKQLAKQLTKRYDANDEKELHEVLYYLPGSEIPDKFETQSRNSSITVKLRSASRRTERFLCFAVCLVFDFENLPAYDNSVCYIHSEYQMKGRDGGYESFKTEWAPVHCKEAKPILGRRSNEHVFVLFRHDMVHMDKQYKEASFNFYIVGQYFHNNKFHKREEKKMKVEKCGVHVFYVDAKSFTVSHVDCCKNFMSNERQQMRSRFALPWRIKH